MNLYLFFFWSLFLLLQTLCKRGLVVEGLGCNWGTRATHPLPPDIVVRLLKDNGFNKVKLFEAEAEPLKALGNSGIQVMIGIPNDYLAALSSSVKAAEDWVQENVSSYVSKYGVDVRYVAVGNEPFLSFYKNMFQGVTFPALKNIQAALIKAGLAKKVKVTVPLNADVYQSASNLPSGGDFRADIHSLMISIIKFLSDNGSPLAINIYPFLSLYADPDFPIDFAFFPNSTNATPSHPLVDGSITYTNVFEANYDTLIWALEKNGFPSMPVIIGEVGWPTDGDPNANLANAQRFNQGLVDRIVRGQGSPKRPSPAPDVYLFGLIDEDAKSVQPGNFERHWGIFYYDGTVKYNLNLGRGKNLVPAKGVKYLSRQWCVMAPEASLGDPNLVAGITYACTYADCTSLGYGSTCGKLDAKSNASFAFNIYFQTLNQQKGACQFNNLAKVTTVDPSQGTCRFEIMIDVGKHERSRNGTTTTTSSSAASPTSNPLLLLLVFVVTSLMIIKWI